MVRRRTIALLPLLFFSVAQAEQQVRINVTVPAGIGAVYITGNSSRLGSWDPKKVEMQGSGTQRWFEMRVADQTRIEFNVTAGGWNRRALGRSGIPQSNWILTVDHPLNLNIEIPRFESPTDPPFEADIRKFESDDRLTPPKPGGIVFIGSSSIRLWKNLASDFPDVNPINRGFGGSEINQSVRVAHRIVTPYRPKAVVFFAGTNDIASGKSPERVAGDFKAFVDKVRAKQPGLPIAFIALTPAPSRWSKLEDVKRTNALVKRYCQSTPGLRFIDPFARFLTPDGGPRPELFVEDQLHMKPQGYAIWVDEVGRALREMGLR